MGRANNERKKRHRARSQERLAKCPSGKAVFRDDIAAKLFIAKKQSLDDSGRDKGLARAYKCHMCYRWHVTSQARKPQSVEIGA